MLLIIDNYNTDPSLIVATIHKLRNFNFEGKKLIWSILNLSDSESVLYINLSNMKYWFDKDLPESDDYYHLILPEQWDELYYYIQERFEEFLTEESLNL